MVTKLGLTRRPGVVTPLRSPIITRLPLARDSRNQTLEHARNVAIDLANGASLISVARRTSNPTSFGIGTMISKLMRKGMNHTEPYLFDLLAEAFPDDRVVRDNHLSRFNRRTVFDHLMQMKVLQKATTSIRDAKPGGSVPSMSEICKVIIPRAEDSRNQLTLEIIRGPGRHKVICEIRFELIWIMRTACGHSLVHIGDAIGGRDHTSILNGLTQMRKKLSETNGPGNIPGNQFYNHLDEADLIAMQRFHSVMSTRPVTSGLS